MIVRRYVVKDMPEAVMSIRKDLGKDAVILSTKKIRVKKWLGLRWQTRLEVTAAVGGDIPLQHRDGPSLSGRAAKAPPSFSSPENRVSEDGPSAGSQRESLTPDFGKSLAVAFDAYQAASTSLQQGPAEVPPAGLQAVMDEIASLKSLVAGTQSPDADQASSEDSVQSQLEAFLIAQGLEAEQARQWVRAAWESNQIVDTLSAGMEQVIDVICRAVGQHNEPAPIRSSSRIVAFVGPTGVGKTTSIAKIAALHVLAGHRRIGLLTTDTFRIAAVHQLQTYADILDVPLVVADEQEAIDTALDQLRDCDLILVDTAGRNFRDGQTVVHTERLLSALSPDETVLVVSLASKTEDADALTALCEPFQVDKFLFTKLDETSTVGTIPRLISKYHRPFSYVTTGQNVPDDIDILSLSDILLRWREEVQT